MGQRSAPTAPHTRGTQSKTLGSGGWIQHQYLHHNNCAYTTTLILTPQEQHLYHNSSTNTKTSVLIPQHQYNTTTSIQYHNSSTYTTKAVLTPQHQYNTTTAVLSTTSGYASVPARLSSVVRVRFGPARLRVAFPPPPVPLWWAGLKSPVPLWWAGLKPPVPLWSHAHFWWWKRDLLQTEPSRTLWWKCATTPQQQYLHLNSSTYTSTAVRTPQQQYLHLNSSTYTTTSVIISTYTYATTSVRTPQQQYLYHNISTYQYLYLYHNISTCTTTAVLIPWSQQYVLARYGWI